MRDSNIWRCFGTFLGVGISIVPVRDKSPVFVVPSQDRQMSSIQDILDRVSDRGRSFTIVWIEMSYELWFGLVIILRFAFVGMFDDISSVVDLGLAGVISAGIMAVK